MRLLRKSLWEIDGSGNLVPVDAYTIDHADLESLAWTSSEHTGTASRVAAFDGTGAATELSSVDAYVTAASTTTAGKVEIATAAETDTGTDATRAVSPDGLQGSFRNLRFIDFVLVEGETDVAVDATIYVWSAPFGGTIIQDDSNKNYFCAWNETAGTTGTMVVDIHLNGTTIMTTNKLDIETGETSTATAATQPDLTTTSFSAGDLFLFAVDAIHTTAAKGLTVRLCLRPS